MWSRQRAPNAGDLLDVNSIHLNGSTGRSSAYWNRAIQYNRKAVTQCLLYWHSYISDPRLFGQIDGKLLLSRPKDNYYGIHRKTNFSRYELSTCRHFESYDVTWLTFWCMDNSTTSYQLKWRHPVQLFRVLNFKIFNKFSVHTILPVLFKSSIKCRKCFLDACDKNFMKRNENSTRQ